jgi:hypothetical protein
VVWHTDPDVVTAFCSAVTRMSSALRQRHTVGSVNSAASDAAHSSLDGRRPARSRQVAGLHLLPLLLLVFFAGSTVLTYYRHTLLPTPRDDATTPLSQFSEERARVHVKALCDMGVRVTGSVENEISAVRYLLQTLSDIRRAMPATGGAWDLEVSVQHPSGTFDLDFLGGFTSAYVNVTNIAARITPREARYASQAPNATALLVSAHFDSALGTQAATDDATNCGNMLEVLRAMTHRPSLPSAVIFLWNGAEETVLQASHGFITQHVWAPTISAFINLEGAGGSGRELVFQTGPKNEWIARAYSKAAPHRQFAILRLQHLVLVAGWVRCELIRRTLYSSRCLSSLLLDRRPGYLSIRCDSE